MCHSVPWPIDVQISPLTVTVILKRMSPERIVAAIRAFTNLSEGFAIAMQPAGHIVVADTVLNRNSEVAH